MSVIALVGLALCILSCGAFLPLDFSSPDDTPMADTEGGVALQYSNNFLLAIQQRPGGENPENEQGVPYFPECWEMLQGTMAANSNEYQLTIALETNPKTPVNGYYLPHDFTQAIIHVTFPDSTVVEMDYYQGYLEGCHELKSPDNGTPIPTLTPPQPDGQSPRSPSEFP